MVCTRTSRFGPTQALLSNGRRHGCGPWGLAVVGYLAVVSFSPWFQSATKTTMSFQNSLKALERRHVNHLCKVRQLQTSHIHAVHCHRLTEPLSLLCSKIQTPDPFIHSPVRISHRDTNGRPSNLFEFFRGGFNITEVREPNVNPSKKLKFFF